MEIRNQVKEILQQSTWLVLVFCFLLLGGCQKNDLIEIEEEREIVYTEYNCPVVGITGSEDRLSDSDSKWKLVLGKHHPFMENPPIPIDYSCEDIIYHFRSDEILVISHDHDGIKAGEYPFTDSGPGGLRRVYVPEALLLMGLQFYNKGSMIAMSSSAFGMALYFVRIE